MNEKVKSGKAYLYGQRQTLRSNNMKLKPYPQYKDSGIQWIGEIPDGWEVRRIKHFSRLFTGSTPDSGNGKYWEGDITWVTPADLSVQQKFIKESKRTISHEGYINSGTNFVNEGAIILATRAPIGYPTIVGTKLCFNQGCKAFEIKRDFFSDYIYYFLNAGIDVIVSKGNVTTFGELSSYDLGSFHVLMPPLPDQTTIANFLDKKTAKIDTLIEKDKKLIALLKEKRTALINHAVTKGLDPNVKLKDSGIPWIGEIPEGWEVRKASRSFDFIGSGTTPKTQEEIYYDKGDIPWVITGDLNDGLLKETSKRISKEAVRDYSTLKIYPKNSLIIAMYGATIGKTALLDIEACTNQACCVLAKSKIFETKYVFYWFIANKNNIISYSYGGGQPNISQDIIKTLKIPLPPKPEQQKIVEYLDKATSKIDKTIQKIENKTNLLEEYKKSSIHHVVTGKVDVRKSEV